MYKVFINNIPVLFSSDKGDGTSTGLASVHFENNTQLTQLLERIPKDGLHVYHDDIELLWSTYKSNYQEISAAGGVVKNTNGEFLFILRNGKWDLPKGKVETGEKLETAAIREVEEECSVFDLIIEKKLPETYHTYTLEDHRILKTTHWYYMTTTWKDKLVPQTEEGITNVEWFAPSKWLKVRENTFPSILDLLDSLYL